MKHLTLYSRFDCPACDTAEAMLLATGQPFDHVFIDDRLDDLVRFGTRVPVLVSATNAELDWPWEVQTLRAWLASNEP